MKQLKFLTGLVVVVNGGAALLNSYFFISQHHWANLLCGFFNMAVAAMSAKPFYRRPKLQIHADGETYTTPILAWRIWSIRSDGNLSSLYFKHFGHGCWLPRTALRAGRCYGRGSHGAYEEHFGPAIACYCGIYAKENLSHIFYAIAGEALPMSHKILGLVFLWGRIVQHEDGYRAEYAYPAEFIITKESDAKAVIEMAEKYGIPCSTLSRWESWKFKHGGTSWILGNRKKNLQLRLLQTLFQQSQKKNSQVA